MTNINRITALAIILLAFSALALTAGELPYTEVPATAADSIGAVAAQIEDTDEVLAGQIQSVAESVTRVQSLPATLFKEMREVIIALAALFAAFLTPVLIVYLLLRYRYKIEQERSRIAEKAMMCNSPLIEYLTVGGRRVRPFIRPALIWMSVGIGLIVALATSDNMDSGLLGLAIIPLLVGVAQLITYFVESRRFRQIVDDHKDCAPQRQMPDIPDTDNDWNP